MRTLFTLFLGLQLCSIVACPAPGGRGSGGDDDDSSSDDDDATADDDDATGDDDDASTDGQQEDLPCEEEIVDVWTLDLPAGAELRARADTVSADTTFDPAMSLFDGVDVDSALYLTGGDDEFPCAFPPPGGYACPELAWTATEATTVGLAVSNLGCANKDGGVYVLELGVDGVPVEGTLAADDYLQGSGR